MSFRFVSALGFGGAFDLGAVQAGLEMVARKELSGGYGVLNILGNRHLLGYNWETDLSSVGDGSDWELTPAEVVLGNPRCSGFSTLSRADFRGAESKANIDMHALIEYAGRAKPEVVVFESVQQAYTGGRDFMLQLRAKLEQMSGESYHLTHVLHNNYALGGVSLRKRYFFVAHRVPFGVEPVELAKLPVLDDALADLEPLGMTWERQPYKSMPTWWSAQMRDGTGAVDGHTTPRWTHPERIWDLVEGRKGVEWHPGEDLSTVMRRYYQKNKSLPKSWEYPSSLALVDDAGEKRLHPETGKVLREPMTKAQVLIRTDFNMGFNQLCRWHGDRPARVITGGGVTQVMHPRLLRTLTHREAARVQGLPDAWRIRPLQEVTEVGSTWGKGTPCHATRWISTWIRRSIEGEPGSLAGDVLPHKGCTLSESDHQRETVINLTHDWKRALEIVDNDVAA